MNNPSSIPESLAGIIREQPVELASRIYRLLYVSNIDELLESLPGHAEVPYWSILWESAIGLSQYLLEHRGRVTGKRVLELGAGLGLCGLVASDVGAASVAQTDNHREALAVARENARLNDIAPPDQFVADWRAWEHAKRYEVILGSDIVYERPIHDALLRIFEGNLLPGGSLYLADPFRESGWEMADLLSKRGWSVDLQSRMVDWDKKRKEILILAATRTAREQ